MKQEVKFFKESLPEWKCSCPLNSRELVKICASNGCKRKDNALVCGDTIDIFILELKVNMSSPPIDLRGVHVRSGKRALIFSSVFAAAALVGTLVWRDVRKKRFQAFYK